MADIPESLLPAYATNILGITDDVPNQLVQFVEFSSTESLLFPYNERQLTDYVWMVVIGSFVAFFVAFGIGANDVANAFATSVGSGALTIAQALVIAAIFEFLGAFFLGSGVTDTVRKKIADPDFFVDQPEIFMYGNLCALTATGFWLHFASFMELPVSTTHSIIGGVVGFAIVESGDAVIWHAEKDEFPFFSGISSVVASWFISPFLSAILAAILFFVVRLLVLRSDHSYERAFIFFPILVFLTVFINVLFILTKGAKSFDEVDDMEFWKRLVISLACGFACGIFTAALSFFLKNKLDAYFEGRTDGDPKEKKQKGAFETALGKVFKGVDVDVHEVVDTNQAVSSIHDHQEKFDMKTEEAFKYLQVFTAICDSFSHGANDVANSVGPFAAIVITYQKGRLNKKAEVPKWILAFGGIGIVIGLGTYGYNIMRAIGVKLIAVTPSRGFAIELGAAIVIALGSFFGLPLSTTHCQVGAEIGVGLLEGHLGVNWPLFARIFLGWIMTIIVVGVLSGVLFSFGAFAPSIQQSHQLTLWREWAGGFSEGVRQAYLLNVGPEPPTVAFDGQDEIRLTPDQDLPVRKSEGDNIETGWDKLFINQLELLTNVKEGYQSYMFNDFSNRFEDTKPRGPLDKTIDILNAALVEQGDWEAPIEVLLLDQFEGVYEVVVEELEED